MGTQQTSFSASKPFYIKFLGQLQFSSWQQGKPGSHLQKGELYQVSLITVVLNVAGDG